MTLDNGNSILPGAATGLLHYNGFTFPPAVKATVSSEPIRDSTNRYTKYIKHTIRVECIVFPGCDTKVFDEEGNVVNNLNAVFPGTLDSVDGDSDETGTLGYEKLRRILTKSGGVLYFNGKGFGYDMSINTNSTSDVSYGPIPSMLMWEPVGDNQAVRIIWTVAVHLAECGSTSPVPGTVAEFAYDAEYAISAVGATVRTISGHLEISNSVATARGASAFSPDAWRDIIDIHLPLGFERTSQTYRITSDRKYLQFKIKDKQIESDYPRHRGMAVEDVRHTMRSAAGFVGSKWIVTISGRFEVALGQPKSLAYQTFLHYVKSRRAQSENAGNAGEDDPKSEPTSKNLVLPISMSIEDDMTGRGFSASMSWYVFPPKKTDFMKKGGFFSKDVEGGSWGSYRQGFLQRNRGGWNPRGDAGMKDNAKNDIYTLCDGTRQPSVRDTYLGPRPIAESHRIFTVVRPTKANSYAEYKSQADLYEDHSSLMIEPTGDALEYTPENQSSSSENTGTGYKVGTSGPGGNPIGDAFSLHKRGRPQYVIRLTGNAIRVGYEIDKPNLKNYSGSLTVGGGGLVPIGNWQFAQTRLPSSEGVPVYSARWTQYYAVNGIPNGKLLRTDSMLGFMT